MAQLTLAQMRTVARTLVFDTSATNPGLSDAEWTVLLNDAMFAYAAMFPQLIATTGLLASVALAANDTSCQLTLSGLTASPRDVTDVFVRTNGPMERVELMDILRAQHDDGTTGLPTRYALYSTNQGQSTGLVWTVKFWRIAGGTYTLDFYGNVRPVTLVSDSDTTLFQEDECREIARLAASVDGARLLGRPTDFQQQMLASLPDRLKEKLGVMQLDAPPRGRTVA